MTVHVSEPFLHPMMPRVDHDELARQRATLAFKMHMTHNVYPGDEQVYRNKTEPQFKRRNGRAPRDKNEVRHVQMQEPYTQMWSSIARTLQEMLWNNVGECVERQLPQLMDTAEKIAGGRTRGTLRLKDGFVQPRYLSAVDIHCMPGSYGADLGDRDVFAGALYDRGAYYYAKGLTGPMCDGTGRALVWVFQQMFPDWKPKRILDVGCGLGGSTLPWKDAFPDAEVHGVDVGAAMLRYGHARAEALGTAVHLSQQNAEELDFADGYFDVVATSGVFHETSGRASRGIMREMFRVLKPGGLAINSDIPHQHANGLHDQFMLDWDAHYNAEPFWAQWTSMTSRELMGQAGFREKDVWEKWRDRDHKGNFTLHDRPKKDESETNGGGIGKGVFWGAVKPR